MTAVGATVQASDFSWWHADRESPAFSGVDLQISEGQKVLLLGPSGAGKSTLLHAMAGVLEDDDASSGTLLIDGVEPRDARGRIGLMQQDPESSIVLSRVGDDLAFGPENLGVDPELIVPRCRKALDAVGLDLPWDHPTSALSGGQKQRLGLAGILAMEPALLLLDEPTANLDPDGVLEVRDSVLKAVESYGSTLIVVEHRVEVWADHVDRIVVLDAGGGIRHDGPPRKVLGEARDELIHAGVWVPGYTPRTPEHDVVPDAAVPLLRAEGLGVSRHPADRRWIRARRRAVLGSPNDPVPALRDVPVAARGIDLEVCAGEHLAITGPNGAGKSTLALTLAGLLEPAEGWVGACDPLRELDQGIPINSRRRPSWDPGRWSSTQLIARIGMVFQEPEHQFVRSTVRDELRLGAELTSHDPGESARGTVDPEERATELLERLGLAHVADANPFTLSGGEKRRLSVGTALSTQPRILILDEPTFGQDATTWASLVDLLRQTLKAGVAVVSVTHDADFVAALGGREFRVGAASAPEPQVVRGERSSAWTS
ncbi:ABC transporter ATP-binding protein [Kocuria massiliensis]|uniref:ABC transporter ATP-binding protein n=1 Tax=Kocuria massiliensis TaxID=1926282 RepID=UPI00117B0CBA|nr:ATP-binding cassette domain-containing protein [Kocuria massiliensis]